MSKLIMIVWDVQHGNAIYMRTPNGINIMFDIGTGSYGEGEEFSPLRYLKIKNTNFKLDYLVISHPHADHISDIKNMVDLELKPKVLSRPKGLSEEFIKDSNRKEDSELVELYLDLDRKYTAPVPDNENPRLPQNNGGVKIDIFSQTERGTSNLNNYSLVAVVQYSGQKIILPGDIEEPGWKALLDNEEFVKALSGTTIFVASHHGRESGYCSDIFNHFKPDIVIISDGRFSDTSATNRYYYHSNGAEVIKRDDGSKKKRYVLTTRKDGVIRISIDENGERKITIS
ncbi:MAG: hypothetical protein DRQ10_07040 [Candidatus Hydrothermota bacterium]|nr:MAG: hypothetical protein DRQ10_07040 [Candidatus Hydrothermae bacterium]